MNFHVNLISEIQTRVFLDISHSETKQASPKNESGKKKSFFSPLLSLLYKRVEIIFYYMEVQKLMHFFSFAPALSDERKP